MLGTRLHPPVASESQNMMPGASCLGSGVWEDRDEGHQVSMDLKSKQCPMGEFSTSYSCCLLPTSPALYDPKETSSQSAILSSEGLEKAVPVVARVGEIGWKCQKNLKALHVNLGYCGLHTPSLQGSRR